MLAIPLEGQAVSAATVVQGRLIAPGSPPFHLMADIDGGSTKIEMFWLGPDKWRRTIDSPNFAQTIIVNGDRVFEHNSDAYFPLDLRTLATAMVDPLPIEGALKPGDPVRTKENGSSEESGRVCYDAARSLCLSSRFGLLETLEPAGHAVDFMNYQSFHNMRIARRLIYSVSAGDFTMAEVTKLEDLKHPDASLFATETLKLNENPIKVADLSEKELAAIAMENPEIIWPQVLDGAQTGEASFYLSLDTTGKIREVYPLSISCERVNDSVVRQLLRWKTKPVDRDGGRVQAEGILSLRFDTRAWGPKETLSDAEARQLATNVVAPVVEPGKYAPGTEYKLWIAVDSDGVVIEKIAAGGPPELFGPCDKALKQWHFSPIIDKGQPRPYRALLVFPIS
jgi:hypothetical protein